MGIYLYYVILNTSINADKASDHKQHLWLIKKKILRKLEIKGNKGKLHRIIKTNLSNSKQ